MPGLRQLKQFNKDIISLGNELTLRASRGEKPVRVPIPKTVKDADDSEDFVVGMPENPIAVDSSKNDEDLSDIMNLAGGGDKKPSSGKKSDSEPESPFAAPDLSSILNPVPSAAGEDASMPDLSMFMDEPEEVEEEPEPEPEEISVADMGLEALLAGAGFDGSEGTGGEPEDSSSSSSDDFYDFDDLDDLDSPQEQPSSPVTPSQVPPGLDEIPAVDEIPELADLGIEELSDVEDTAPVQEIPEADELLDADVTEAAGELLDEIPELDDLSFDAADEPSDALPADDFLESLDTSAPAAADDLAPAVNDEELGLAEELSPLEAAPDAEAFDLPEELELPDDLGVAEEVSSEPPVIGDFDMADVEDLQLEDSPVTSGPVSSLDDLEPLAEQAEPFENDFSGSFDLPDLDGLSSVTEEPAAASDSGSADGLDFSDVPDLSDLGDIAEFDAGEKNTESAPADMPDLSLEPGAETSPEVSDELSALTSDFDSLADSFPAADDGAEPSIDDSMIDGDLPLVDISDMDVPDEAPAQDDTSAEAPDDFSSFDLSDMDISTTGLDDLSAGAEIPDYDDSTATEEGSEPLETFDTSGMEDMDFGIPDTDSSLDSDFELGDADDIAMEGSDFEIQGFTDVEVADDRNPRADLDIADFSGGVAGNGLPPNTLSDEQYKIFLKNLGEYPLNVRLAFEDLIVQDEFTDDAEFEIIEKILRKAPARQVAATLEKMLDTSIPVPRDFEHRTAEEYEAYKKSIQYQLRNKILPATLMGILLLLVGWGLFNFSKNVIFIPAKAAKLYKQGYALLQADEYPQAQLKFDEAASLKMKKNWFFNFARGYRSHKQYQRAGDMYQKILSYFKHDKAAGLEYADMELNDLANYARAEEIIRREVLDYHVNDADGILMLGDTFLEWGTEKDPEKMDLALEEYMKLIQLYKANNLYNSRLMRYYIRKDNLLQVLYYQKMFETNTKSLQAEDWTELSGYLLEKLYGKLSPAEEPLRYQIEGLRRLLITAVNADSSNPVAFYNLGRYFVEVNEVGSVEATLQGAIKRFNDAPALKNRDLYKYIDAYRLLGENYVLTEDYLKAQEQFADGISLYTIEKENAGFKGNEKIGKLYEDFANINYSIAGDYDSAAVNYRSSVELGNDSPSIRYRLGYISYMNKNYLEALGSFMKAGENNLNEKNLQLAMANTLSLRNDDYAAEGYYEHLINRLDDEILERGGGVFPQADEDEYDLVSTYLRAANNYGVTLFRLAKRTGNSNKNAQAIVQFQQSVRAWDALTRNQETLVRLGGSNLAEENIKYITHPVSEFEPAIYIDIPKNLNNSEKL